MSSDPKNVAPRSTCGTVLIDFPAIEALQSASQAAGWEIQYRQLGAGPLRATTYLRDRGDMSFIRETANRRLQIVAESPADAVTLIVPSGTGGLRINGYDVGHEDVVVLAPGSDMLAISEAGADALSIHVPRSAFRRFAGVMESDGDPDWMSSTRRLTLPAVAASRLRGTIEAAIGATADSVDDLTIERRSALSIEALASAARKSFIGEDRSACSERHRTLRALLEYIDQNLGNEFMITDLCRLSGKSLSTVERLFRNEVQMTPLAYIRSRRLDAVRRILTRSQPDRSIARVAFDHGFTHMGRFAGDYRRQFGILPSEDRGNVSC